MITPRKGVVLVVQLGLFLGLVAAAVRHLERMSVPPSLISVLVLISFLFLAFHLIAAQTNPLRGPQGSDRRKKYVELRDNLNTTLVIPVYNEDPACFQRLLDSISAQSWLPKTVYIVDDGSDSDECYVKAVAWSGRFPNKVIIRQVENGGKRHAQAYAFRECLDTDVFITIDSDTVLHPDAVRQGLMPFADPEITAVGGIIYPLNWKTNLVTRLTDLGFTGSFLNGRSAWSRVGAVTVHCGALGFYRGEVVRRNLDHYLNQTVFGEPVSYGDDRMLTQYACLAGKSVTQESCVAWTLLPERMKHLYKQRIRWSRSYWWGGMWLIKHAPMTSPAWWLTAFNYMTLIFFYLLVPLVFVLAPIATGNFPWEFFVYIGLLSYLRNAKYLQIVRDDQTFRQQFGNYLLSPLSGVFHVFLVNGLHLVGLTTIRNHKWGTRSQVEVAL